MIKTIDLRTLPTINDKTTIIKDVPLIIKQFLELPSGIAKNYRYSKIINSSLKEFETVSLFQRNDDIYFSCTNFTIGKNKNSYYLRPLNKSGLSYKSNKLSIWFGKSVENIPHIDKLYEMMNWNFIENCCKGYITKSILEKLFKGKITNSREILSNYAKSVRLKASTEWLYRAVKLGLSKSDLYRYGIIAESVDHFLEYYVNKPKGINVHYRDLINQFTILDKKINFRWSDKRIMQEHTDATKILMEYEIGVLSEDKIEYPDLKIPLGFELLDNQKRAYIEGKTMKHCVYTNYWNRIEKLDYLALHVKLNEEDATLGLSIDNEGKLKFNQLYSYQNSKVSGDMREACNNWIQNVSEYKVKKPALRISKKEVGLDLVNRVHEQEIEDFYF